MKFAPKTTPTKVALGLTILWVLFSFTQFGDWIDLPANAQGDALAGFFSPLVFVWLIAGYFQNSIEIRQGNKQLEQQAEQLRLQREELEKTRETLKAQQREMAEAALQAKAQAEAVRANADHAARATFLQLSKVFERDLRHYAIYIYSLIVLEIEKKAKPRGVDYFPNEKFISEDEFSFFVRVSTFLDQGSPVNFLLEYTGGKPIPEVRKYIRVFEKLLEEVDRIDDANHSLRREYEWCPMGEMYSRLVRLPGTGAIKLKYAYRSTSSDG
jgi:hypothetical protein